MLILDFLKRFNQSCFRLSESENASFEGGIVVQECAVCGVLHPVVESVEHVCRSCQTAPRKGFPRMTYNSVGELLSVEIVFSH